jgi:hypothetical protein
VVATDPTEPAVPAAAAPADPASKPAGGPGAREPRPSRRVASTLPRVRRPSGEKAALPRAVPRVDLAVAAAAALALVLWAVLAWSRRSSGGVGATDLWLLDAATRLRSDVVVDTARFLAGIERNGVADLLTIAVVVGLLWFRRFRRLAVFALTLLVVQLLASHLQHLMAAPRPFGVERLARWEGYGDPSLPVAHLAIVLLGVVYGFVPDGRRRRVALLASIAVVAAVAASGVVLGIEYPSYELASFGFAYLLGIAAFRLACPDGAFSVQYRAGPSAHLTLDDERLATITQTLAEQLGLRVLDVEPFGLGESGGSTPMRILVDSERPIWLFAKLYAEQHLRADRLYKSARALLYGRLEDENGFGSVRRLVQNEDYYLRVFRDVGAPVIDTHGFVELVPEREFLLVMEFAEDAVELGHVDAPFSDDLIDQGLALIRLLWDNGIAHRDVKPANLLVQHDELRMVDCGFAELRPSPWRQAVDLANMMLCLALGRDAPTVYQRARRLFSPEDIAESFAATRSVTIPTQLRALLDEDGRDLVAEFRRLAPRRARVPIQRWSLRRVAAISATLAGGGVLLWAALTVFVWHDRSRINPPTCPNSNAVLLVAQSAAQAGRVPCVAIVPEGWRLRSTHVDQSRARLDFGDGTTLVQVTYALCPAGTSSEPPGATPAAGVSFDSHLPGQRAWIDQSANACLTAVVSGGDPAHDEDAVEAVAGALRWIDRRRLDSSIANLTNGKIDSDRA